jgi:hypothetical protein
MILSDAKFNTYKKHCIDQIAETEDSDPLLSDTGHFHLVFNSNNQMQ